MWTSSYVWCSDIGRHSINAQCSQHIVTCTPIRRIKRKRGIVTSLVSLWKTRFLGKLSIELICSREVSLKLSIRSHIIVERVLQQVTRRVKIESYKDVWPTWHKAFNCCGLWLRKSTRSSVIIGTYTRLSRWAVIIVCEHVSVIPVEIDSLKTTRTRSSLSGIRVPILPDVSKVSVFLIIVANC